MISVVIPAYNEEKMIAKTTDVICGILKDASIAYELVFVDDGSKDGTWKEVQKASEGYPGVRGISFSRNFGKESAIFAGLAAAKGECAVVIDCDLQHPPEKIVEMYRLWEEGYEIVEGIKASRGKESVMHAFAAKCFYSMISDATGIDMSRASDYKLLDRNAINVLLNMREKKVFFRALSSWIGFKTTQIEYDVMGREAGESKWSTRSLIRYALTNITSFTVAPLQLITVLGILLFVITVALSIQTVIYKIMGIAAEGFTTIIILQCFTSSTIMMSLGIMGYYIAKIYEEIKGRPKYIVAEETGKGRTSYSEGMDRKVSE